MPAVHIKGGHFTEFSVITDFLVQEMDGFNVFARDLVYLPNVTWTISSSLTVHSLGLTFSGIEFTKEVTLDGNTLLYEESYVYCYIV